MLSIVKTHFGKLRNERLGLTNGSLGGTLPGDEVIEGLGGAPCVGLHLTKLGNPDNNSINILLISVRIRLSYI